MKTLNVKKTLFLSALLLFTALLLPFSGFAQEDEGGWIAASPSSQAYHKYRNKATRPPYGLAKILAMVKAIKETDDEGLALPDQKAYQALSLREKFTYHLIYPETYSQNCDVMPPILDEDKKIFGQLPDVFNEAEWSERQVKFMVKNRDSVMAIMKESVNRTKRVGLNYKAAIVEINGKEMIPYLIDIYNLDHKDRDILTVLMLLMKKGKYKPFMTSASFVKLYGAKSDYRSAIDYNKPNEDLVISRATAFYESTR